MSCRVPCVGKRRGIALIRSALRACPLNLIEAYLTMKFQGPMPPKKYLETRVLKRKLLKVVKPQLYGSLRPIKRGKGNMVAGRALWADGSFSET